MTLAPHPVAAQLQEPSSNALEDPSIDPALPVGLVLAAGASALVAVGVVENRASPFECSSDLLCYEQGDRTRRAAAIGAIAGGSAMGAVAVPIVLVGMLDPNAAKRRSNAAMVMGMALTALGTASLAAGIGMAATSGNAATPAAIAMVASGALLGPGIPLWVKGQRSRASSAADAAHATVSFGGGRLMLHGKF